MVGNFDFKVLFSLHRPNTGRLGKGEGGLQHRKWPLKRAFVMYCLLSTWLAISLIWPQHHQQAAPLRYEGQTESSTFCFTGNAKASQQDLSKESFESNMWLSAVNWRPLTLWFRPDLLQFCSRNRNNPEGAYLRKWWGGLMAHGIWFSSNTPRGLETWLQCAAALNRPEQRGSSAAPKKKKKKLHSNLTVWLLSTANRGTAEQERCQVFSDACMRVSTGSCLTGPEETPHPAISL